MIQTHQPTAGPSRYRTTSSASHYTSVSSTINGPPSPISPLDKPTMPPTHVQAMHDFEPALLASTSTADPNMYLSFRAGEIIRVHVRDGTGWWDGEISAAGDAARAGPRRGWFPSNYVKEMGFDGAVHQRAESSFSAISTSSRSYREPASSSIHTRQTSSASHQSRASASTANSHGSHGPHGHRTPSVTRSPKSLSPPLQELLHKIVQSLTLLESAIHSHRKTHIQPATALVISSIRSALQQIDCLSKESPALTAWPALAKERKTVLVDLSRLVACARSASGVSEAQTDDALDAAQQMEILAKAARCVFASVKRFLMLANDHGLKLVNADSQQPVREDGLPTPTSASHTDGTIDVAPQRPSVRRPMPSNARMQETFRTKTASIGDLRAARRRQSSPPPPMPTTSGILTGNSLLGRVRSPSAGTPLSATAPSSSSGRTSPSSARSMHDRFMRDSIDSGSWRASTQSSDGGRADSPTTTVPPSPPITIERQLGSVQDVLEAVGLAEDALLSIIAAFIGHIHSHHIGSHPSSHAHLIEMTRETVDAVRELLKIVEMVGRNAGIRLARPREVENLRLSKDQLYGVASSLVAGSETLAEAPFADVGDEEYDTEKAKLLQHATGTLRAGTDCVRWIRSCLPDDEMTHLPHTITTPRQGDSQIRHSTPRPADAAVVCRDKVVGGRGVHTLSGLHRKVTSLNHLQKRYQQDGSLVHAPEEEGEETEETEDEEEIVADSGREEDLTLRPVVPVNFPFAPRQTALLQTPFSPDKLSVTPKPPPLGARSYSDDGTPIPRSRSSSLSSPAPPRIRLRSPSRSADLDKFTGDYDIPLRLSRRLSPESSSAYVSTHPSSVAGSSLLSSNISEVPDLVTPHAISSLSLEPPAILHSKSAEFVPGLSSSTNNIVNAKVIPQSIHLLRPAPLNRSLTAPMPVTGADPRHLVVSHDYDPREVTFNSEGTMIGASLAVLVEKMTPHDGPVDSTFSSVFFFTFRLFTTPLKLVETIISRYDLQPPPSVALGERDRAHWLENKLVPIRFRIYNFLKTWLDAHWLFEADTCVVETLHDFASDAVSRTLPAMAPRLLESIQRRRAGNPRLSILSDRFERTHKRSSSSDRIKLTLGLPPTQAGLPPTPMISKSLHTLLQKNPDLSKIVVTEFDTLELARQFTIMESKLFCAVAPEDLVGAAKTKKTVPELKALSTMSNQITGWVADGILNEHDAKKRAFLLKFYIKLADKCLMLNNFSTLFAVLAGLNSSIVLRLKKTWDALSSKYRVIMERLRGVIEHVKNHAAYRQKLREVQGPCLPFLGLILTDITFTCDGNADTRPSALVPELMLINQDKYAKLGKIALDFQRYQDPFNFHELEAVQTFLKRILAERGSGSLDALYRKSLLLEPRQGSERLSRAVEKPGWLGVKA